MLDGDVIDIDYQNLRRSLDEVDAPTDSSSLTIIFEPEQKAGSAADYVPSTRMARVEVDPEFISDAQHLLVHELKHYSDDVKGHRSMRRHPAYDKLYDISPSRSSDVGAVALTLVAVPTLLEVGVISGMANDISLDSRDRLFNVLDLLLATNSTIALGLVALHCVYVFDQSERRARKTAKDSRVSDVLRVVPSDELA